MVGNGHHSLRGETHPALRLKPVLCDMPSCLWGCSGSSSSFALAGLFEPCSYCKSWFSPTPVSVHGFCFLRFSTGRCHLISLPCMLVLVVADLPLSLCFVQECNCQRLPQSDPRQWWGWIPLFPVKGLSLSLAAILLAS